MLLGLALAAYASASSGNGSLGVGLDVLPAAYTFAASRFDFTPDLQLTRCDRTSCRWSTGHGVDLVAYVSEWNLDVNQLEVDATEAARNGSADKLWFQRACSTVVALSLSGAEPSEVQAITYSISPPSGLQGNRRERDAGGVRFYGSVSAGRSDSARIKQRCGAMAIAR